MSELEVVRTSYEAFLSQVLTLAEDVNGNGKISVSATFQLDDGSTISTELDIETNADEQAHS